MLNSDVIGTWTMRQRKHTPVSNWLVSKRVGGFPSWSGVLTWEFISPQELMRSFNRDRRIFCALLSTHSRATGVSLVEADAVVFYDHDLNPVMDAKAQEWCDRIGRRKDVHIYRWGGCSALQKLLLCVSFPSCGLTFPLSRLCFLYTQPCLGCSCLQWWLGLLLRHKCCPSNMYLLYFF